jgi:peptidoglycan-associated lipoprotein
MKRSRATWWVIFGATWLLATTACQTTRSTPPVIAEEKPAQSTDAGRPVGTESKTIAATLQPVYFDYDRWNLREDARRALRANAEMIQAHAEWGTVTIEGHCDERGSAEYNLALGEKRATVVKSYLVDLGVPLRRLRTVSFGEQVPAVPGHTESAWRHNRRAELEKGAHHASL